MRIDDLLAKNRDALSVLQLGSKVSFENKNGQKFFAIVIKINRKTLVVLTEDNHQYKISPGLVQLVKDTNSEK